VDQSRRIEWNRKTIIIIIRKEIPMVSLAVGIGGIRIFQFIIIKFLFEKSLLFVNRHQ
jgi:hypothetical protein